MNPAISLRRDEAAPRSGPLGLLGMVGLLLVGALLLRAVAGLPHLPTEVPSWQMVVVTLQGSEVPLPAVAYVLTTAAWILWAWLVASLLLRLGIGVAERMTGEAAWTRSLRAVSDRITLPIVRRAVDGALVAVVVANLVVRAPQVSAAPLATPPAVAAMSAPVDRDVQPNVPTTFAGDEQRVTSYKVRPGDTLWDIAVHFYGTGEEYPRLVTANVGRTMADGRVFTPAGVIQPGWVLEVPLPSQALVVENGRAYYTVEAGDTLRGIAARLLGDEMRWPEIYDLNHGRARLDDGRLLGNPDLIWPGLRLEIPRPTGELAAVPAAPPAKPTVAPPPPPTIATLPPSVPPPTRPTPTGPPPTVTPATPTALPTPRPTPEAPGGTQHGPLTSSVIEGAVGLTAVLAVGGAFLARRRFRRSLDEPPAPPVAEAPDPSRNEFADVELGRALAHRLQSGEGDAVGVVGTHALRFFGEHGVGDIAVVLAQHGRGSLGLLLSARLVDQERVLELADQFGARLARKHLAQVTSDQDVFLHLTGLALAGAIAPAASDNIGEPPLIPVGLLPNRETLYANWRELGNVLITGLPSGGTNVVLTSLVSALAARLGPDELGLWTIASRRTLPGELAEFPHQRRGFVEPADAAGVASALEQVRAELERRMRAAELTDTEAMGARVGEPELVVVVGELADLVEHRAALDQIAVHGPRHEVRLLAASARVDDLGEEVLADFASRLVLQTLDDEESIRLLGRPDAADLGGAEILLRIDGREPVRVRGLRVSEDHLRELARLMAEAYAETGRHLPVHCVSAEGNRDGAGEGAAQPTYDALREGDRQSDHDLQVVVATRDLGDRGDESWPAKRTSGTVDANADEDLARNRSEGYSAQVDVAPSSHEPSNEDPVAQVAEFAAEASTLRGYGNNEDIPIVEAGPEPAEPVRTTVRADVVGGSGNAALLHVRCFGGFAVTAGDRAITPERDEMTSYRAWEVLAYLAAHPEGAVPKDILAAAIWPGAAEELSANRLRSTLGRLRQLLRSQVPGLPGEFVRSDRYGICRLDTSLVWSDVHRFVALKRSAASLPAERAKAIWLEALELYQGDLLLGHGARVGAWIEAREGGQTLRERYHDDYIEMARQLARQHCAEGQPILAVPLYKNLLKMEPILEDLVRDLYRCYEQLDDVGSLIREERRLRQAIRAAYYDPQDPEEDPDQYQPQAETVELFQQIRARLEGKEPVNVLAPAGGRGASGRG